MAFTFGRMVGKSSSCLGRVSTASPHGQTFLTSSWSWNPICLSWSCFWNLSCIGWALCVGWCVWVLVKIFFLHLLFINAFPVFRGLWQITVYPPPRVRGVKMPRDFKKSRAVVVFIIFWRYVFPFLDAMFCRVLAIGWIVNHRPARRYIAHI